MLLHQVHEVVQGPFINQNVDNSTFSLVTDNNSSMNSFFI